METNHRQWDSETSGGAMEAPGRGPSVRSRAGRVLRHWTTNHLESVGKATTRASGAGDWGLADGRQQPGGVEIEVARRPAGCVVKPCPRSWDCRNCGRSNETELALDGTLTCEYCTEVGGPEALRPSRVLLRRAGKIVSWMTGEPGGEQRLPAARGR